MTWLSLGHKACCSDHTAAKYTLLRLLYYSVVTHSLCNYQEAIPQQKLMKDFLISQGALLLEGCLLEVGVEEEHVM